MVTAFAGLRHGVIGRYTPIDDTGVYSVLGDKGNTYRPTCWYYQLNGVGHGSLDVVQALERSCNYFFMSVADRIEGGWDTGAYALAEAAQEFGLGRTTGLEISENPGRLATPEFTSEVLNTGWYRADTVMTGFGQGHNQFTPVQLANYAATIANGGTLHALTILRRIKSADFSELLYTHEPVVLNVIEETEYIEIVQEGMRAVARGGQGTARSVFSDYPVRVAAKTGTVQQETSDINNGVFVCYAPADDPQIAISVVIEKGGSGSAVMDVARMIFDYYFRAETIVLATPYGALIP
jgi:penicillin-binding protein 2